MSPSSPSRHRDRIAGALATTTIVAGVATAACAVVPHPAHVRPGALVAIAAGAAQVGQSRCGDGCSPSKGYPGPVAQVTTGYGWRRTQVYLALTLAHPLGHASEGERPISRVLAASTIGLYRQLTPARHRWAGGAGLLVGLSPEPYLMAGRRYRGGSVDGGVRACVARSWCVHGFTAARFDGWRGAALAAWVDGFVGTIDVGDEHRGPARYGVLAGIQLELL